LGFPFFTLTPEYRSALFNQLHEIVFFGKGGYDWNTVYNMPIWLRRFTFNTINEFYQKEKEEYDKITNKGELITADKPLAKPNIPQLKDITPTYTSKATKK
jgi:hypothetical protein